MCPFQAAGSSRPQQSSSSVASRASHSHTQLYQAKGLETLGCTANTQQLYAAAVVGSYTCTREHRIYAIELQLQPTTAAAVQRRQPRASCSGATRNLPIYPTLRSTPRWMEALARAAGRDKSPASVKPTSPFVRRPRHLLPSAPVYLPRDRKCTVCLQ
jgi:hypothetical protein